MLRVKNPSPNRRARRKLLERQRQNQSLDRKVKPRKSKEGELVKRSQLKRLLKKRRKVLRNLLLKARRKLLRNLLLKARRKLLRNLLLNPKVRERLDRKAKRRDIRLA